MRLTVQVTDVHKKLEKNVFASLVMSVFSHFLGASRTCASIVFSISRFGAIHKSSEIFEKLHYILTPLNS